MHVEAHLDIDVVAVETEEQVNVLVQLVAPTLETEVERAATTLVVVLDRSGSMHGERLDAAKQAIAALVDRLDPRDRFGVVVFDDHVDVVVPAGPLHNKEVAKAAIQQVEARGSTDLSAGYLRGLQEARRVAGGNPARVLLISDGHANAGVTDPTQLAGIAGKAHTDGVTTSALGMGLGYDEAIIAAVARGGSGSELFAEDADTAIPLIASEVEGLLTQSVQAASMLVTMAPAVAGVRILNDLPVNAVDGGALVELGGFLSGEERKVLLDFAVPGMAALGLAQIASLEIRYVQLPELVEHVVTMPVHVNVVPSDVAASRVPDPLVRTEVVFQQVQRAKQEASTRLRDGDTPGALKLLRTAQAAVADVVPNAPAAQAADLRQESGVLDVLIERATRGEVSYSAKMMSADASYKSRTRGRRP